MERDYSLIHLDQTVSTNSYLNTLCEHEEVPDFTVVWADFQTAGRGQRGNSWESNAGENLTFSYVLHPDFVIAQEQFLLSEIAALAVKETLEEYVEYVSIKWPNDVYWKQKKICGMLIENNLTGISIHRSICGVGININQEVFNGSAPNPISLRQIIGRVVDPALVLSSFMKHLHSNYELLKEGNVKTLHSYYMQSLFRREGLFCFKDKQGEFKASIEKVELNGRLWLKDEDRKERSYLFKEVEYVL